MKLFKIVMTKGLEGAIIQGISSIKAEIRDVEREMEDHPVTGQTAVLLEKSLAEMREAVAVLRGVMSQFGEFEKENQ